MRALLLLALVASSTAAAGTAIARVDAFNNAFVDEAGGWVLTQVPVGATVVWTIREGGHTVTGRLGGFGTGHLVAGETYAHTFTLPGAYPYQCRWHPGMEGLVVVA